MIDGKLTLSIFVALLMIEMVKAMIHEYFESRKIGQTEQFMNFMLEMAEKGKVQTEVKTDEKSN